MKRLSFANLRVHLILLVLIAALQSLGLMLYTDIKQRERSAAEVQDHVCRMANLAASEECLTRAVLICSLVTVHYG